MTPDAILPIQRLREERVPIRLLMEERIDKMERAWFPKEPGSDWEALRALDYEEEFLRTSAWLFDLLANDPFPPEVNGLYFGFLFPPPNDFTSTVAIFLSGSRFHGRDRDWARKGEVPEDKFIDHSAMLLAAYRNLAAADHLGNDAREVALVFCHLFVSLVVAEWTCGPMRHLLRGQAPSRGVFVGLDPWMGFGLGVLKPDRPGGGGSVIVSWRGRLADGKRQAEWLTSVREVANWHEARWNEVEVWDERRLEQWVQLREGREIPKRAPLRWFDEDLTGRILVDPDVLGDAEEFRREAARCGLALDEIEIQGRLHVLLPLDRLEVRGVDFRAFDLRGLYPTEDRLSFVLLGSKDAPFLNGRIAALDERSFNRKAYAPPVAEADWYVQSPSVHLRDYFEEWTAEWLAWLRFFFAPDFQGFHRDDPAFDDARHRPQHALLDARFGREKAMALGLRRLHLHFLVEANRAAEIFGD